MYDIIFCSCAQLTSFATDLCSHSLLSLGRCRIPSRTSILFLRNNFLICRLSFSKHSTKCVCLKAQEAAYGEEPSSFAVPCFPRLAKDTGNYTTILDWIKILISDKFMSFCPCHKREHRIDVPHTWLTGGLVEDALYARKGK